jgi:hypothetical protein
MNARSLLLVIVAASIGTLPLACGPKKPAEDGFSNGGYGGSGYAGTGGYSGTAGGGYAGGTAGYAGGTAGYAGGTAGYAGGTAGTTGAAGTTGNPTDIFANLGSMLGAVLGGAGPNDAIALGIQGSATQNAPGMQPAGSAVRLNLQQGQTSEGQFTLEPGKCYTLIGASNPGVIETSIKVTMPAPLQTQVLGQNASGPNPMPVVWGSGNCYRSPAPIAMPVRLEVTMVMGAGQIGIQPYAK